MDILNELWVGMDLQAATKVSSYRGQEVRWVTEKLDGHRYTVWRRANGLVRVTSRKDIDIWDKLKGSHIAEKILSLPEHTRLECEFHCPTVFATSVPTLINTASEDLIMSAFAVPIYGGEYKKELGLEEVQNLLDSHGIPTPKILASFDEPVQVSREEWGRWAQENRKEGVVAKEAHLSGWYKIKPIRELDAVITGWYQGTGRNFGRLGALSIAVYNADGVIIPLGKVGTGFDDDHRTEITRKDIGRVIQVEYDEVNSQGSLRFPRFVRFRDDKSPEDCLVEQLET